MSVMKYEAHFYELARHATSILDAKNERVHCSVRGMRLSIRMATQILVVGGQDLC